MRLARFEHRAVVHDSRGEVCKILLPEKRKRYPAQLFGKAYSAHAGFDIGCEECAVILKICTHEDHCGADHRADGVKRDARGSERAAEHIRHKAIQHVYRQHE